MDLLELIQWRPGIGDPSIAGWLTVVGYFAASALAWGACVRTRRVIGLPRGSREIWALVAVLMLVLCINKQLDLQSLLTDIGRVVARRDGWYADRHAAQLRFIEGILAASVGAAVVFGALFRGFWRANVLLGLGLALLVTFVATRAISFHHVDLFIGTTVAGVRMNWLVELTGIVLIAAAAARAYPEGRRRA
jgi:hypothetical protein